MYILLLTSGKPDRNIFRRKGGGGRGGGGSGGGSHAGGSGGGGRSGSSGSPSTGGKAGGAIGSINLAGANRSPIPITVAGTSTQATPFGYGGGSRYTIPPNQAFSGRVAGGGTRYQVYGTSTYGSGYPGISGPGVQNRGFPFIFYPIVYPTPDGVVGSYLYEEGEYGNANDSTRPGGSLYQFSVSSNASTFHVIADNSTASFLQATITVGCHNATNFDVSFPTPFNSSQTSYLKPEQAIQYYRASSVVLTLDGYNNTAALGANPSAAPISLPSNIDVHLMTCINQTIGSSVPLIGGASSPYAPSNLMLVCLVWMLWCFGDL